MLVFPGMIADIARDAGMKVPKNPDDGWEKNKFLHFWVFCEMSLGRPVNWGHFQFALRRNAKTIVNIPTKKLNKMALCEVQKLCESLV